MALYKFCMIIIIIAKACDFSNFSQFLLWLWAVFFKWKNIRQYNNFHFIQQNKRVSISSAKVNSSHMISGPSRSKERLYNQSSTKMVRKRCAFLFSSLFFHFCIRYRSPNALPSQKYVYKTTSLKQTVMATWPTSHNWNSKNQNGVIIFAAHRHNVNMLLSKRSFLITNFRVFCSPITAG